MTTNEHADDLLVQALGSGMSYTTAGEVVGLSKATVARRMTDEAFRARVTEARQRSAAEAVELIEGASLRAAEVLVVLLDADSELARWKAANSLLDRASERGQARALGDRLAAIERRLDEQAAERRSLRGVA